MTHQNSARSLRVPAGRLERMTRLGSMATGIAGSMAIDGARQLGRRQRPVLRDLLLTAGNIRRVADELAHLRGAAMKVGQLMSMDRGDMLPPELADVLARLRADAHFMPPEQLKTVLNRAWGAHWLRDFRSFEVRPVAAASIGQVHRAQLRDGRTLAVKVQYPGVAQSIDSDVANVGALIRVSGLLPKAFDLAPYLEEARRQLHEEADYVREGAHLARFEALLTGSDAFEVPVLDEERTTREVLAMSFLAGEPIDAAARHAQSVRDRIAALLIELLLRELFEFGLMQTDPNFANYLFQPATERIALLDFGATRRLDPDAIAGCRQLVAAGLSGDREAICAATQQIGFLQPATKPHHQDRVLGMVVAMFAETCGAPVFDFGATGLARLLQSDGLALAQDGFVPPPVPMDLLYLQRKLGGIFLLASRLRARVPVRELLAVHLDGSHSAAARAPMALG